ncbi:MAG: UMP kinase [Desulfurococcaceae archaeon]
MYSLLQATGPLVVKVTGKAFDSPEILARTVEQIRELARSRSVLVVVGGGSLARKAIDLARSLGVASNFWLDEIGIEASRLNALLMAAALSPLSAPKIPSSLREALDMLASHRVVVMGGLVPGQSTAAVALEAAEMVGAREVYGLSAAGKVYDSDPSANPNARPLDVVKAAELKAILGSRGLPGDYALIDSTALDVAIRSKITIKIADYRRPELLAEMVSGGNPGTTILPE